MKVAIVHDWLVAWGGAEKVLSLLLQRFPEAELFTMVNFLDVEGNPAFRKRKIHTSALQKLPGAKKYYRQCLPLMPLLVEQFDLRGFDLIISSSHAVAKGVIPPPEAVHLCYCYSPMRYAWDMQHQYLEQTGSDSGIKSWLLRWQLHRLRQWDFLSAQRVDRFVAISHYIERRIWQFYRRNAEVIYPPVETSRFRHDRKRDEFYLAASRLVPYKRLDLIIDTFNRMPHKHLVVIGDGPERKRLTSMAGPNITLLGYQEDAVLIDYLERAKAFVFMAKEDFGILPVEAQAAGAPVIGYGIGGLAETVLDGKTGIHVPEQTSEALRHAVERFEDIRARDDGFLSAEQCRKNALQFHQAIFEKGIDRILGAIITNPKMAGREKRVSESHVQEHRHCL